MKSYEELLVKLLEKSETFSEKLTDLNNQNNSIKDATIKLQKSLYDLKISDSHTVCKICFCRPRTHAVQPCHHAGFCQNCAERALNRGRCFVCRTAITGFVTIYM